MNLGDYVADLFARLPFLERDLRPARLVGMLPTVVARLAPTLRAEGYHETDGVFVHPTATIEAGAIVKGPAIVSQRCFIAATAYLRGGVFLDQCVTLGPGTEVKSSVIMAQTVLAHFNFIGDSIVGTDVNFEAGAVIANHYNERPENAREVKLALDGAVIGTGVTKFGAVVGDRSRVGANAVLSPGTVLTPGSVVARLSLVNQERVIGS